MDNLPDKIRKTTEDFIKNIHDTFGDSLQSVVLYGPAVRGESDKEPYINFMVIVDDNTPSELARCAKYMKSWRKNLITTPLFLAPGYIRQSLDTFPLEFLTIASSYQVVYGDDVLENLEFRAEDVRNQCERELKGKLLHLRAEYLSLRSDKKGLIDLISRSLNAFRLVFSGALYLKQVEIPKRTSVLFDVVVSEYELDTALFQKLLFIAQKKLKIDEGEVDTLFDLYVEELDKLSHAIDEMPVTEE